MRRNRDAADRILGAEYSLMAPGIGEMPRATWLDSLHDVHSYELITVSIRVYGETAVRRVR